MFKELEKFWKKHGFEICVILSIFVIFIIWLFFRRGKKGTYNTSYSYIKTSKKRPPQESKGEIECRRVLQSIFNKSFPKIRPNMLRNPVTSSETDNINLELDCYNDELKLAVEYNGMQHYKYMPFFHKNKETFQNQKYRDHMKRDLCIKNGIKLIEVPYTVKIQDIENYIKKELKFN